MSSPAPSKSPKISSPCDTVCRFCGTATIDEIDLGKLHRKADVCVHNFCMLLSSGLVQNARLTDKKSILGFTLPDIKKEVSRGKRLRCCFCKKPGATIGCCVSSCRKAFHLPCGRSNGTMHHFYDEYRSYCSEHKVKQQLTPRKRGKSQCIICMMPITSWQPNEALLSPCCIGSTYHRRCMQQYALSAGLHFFKCPMCNDVNQFKAEMIAFGIFLPDQDASWEKEPGAFNELYDAYSQCDADICECPYGRKYGKDSGPYKILLCQNCGSFGSHKECKGLVGKQRNLSCPNCIIAVDRSEHRPSTPQANQSLQITIKSGRTSSCFSTPNRTTHKYTTMKAFTPSTPDGSRRSFTNSPGGTPHGRRVTSFIGLARPSSNKISNITEVEAPLPKRRRKGCLFQQSIGLRPSSSSNIKTKCIVQCTRIDQQLSLVNGSINVNLISNDSLNECPICSELVEKYYMKDLRIPQYEISIGKEECEEDVLVHLEESSLQEMNVSQESHNSLKVFSKAFVCDLKIKFYINSPKRKVCKKNVLL